MMLEGKTALVFAAGGAVGSAVAGALAAQGAQVHASARDRLALRGLPAGIATDAVDAADADAVARYIDGVAARSGGIDIVFNAIGPRPAVAGYGTPATMLAPELFMLPLQTIVASQFLTARSAARHMLERRRGSIVLLSASLSGSFIPMMAGITAACGAVEAMMRSLAAEFSPAGVRVNCVRAGGMPATRTIRETSAAMARSLGVAPEAAAAPTVNNLLRRGVGVGETAAAIAWIASDAASGITGQVINVCAGAVVS